MIKPYQFRDLIIDPVLHKLNMWSPVARNLLLGTAIAESRLEYLKQINGPALGIYQIEPATHKDLWVNFLNFRHELRDAMIKVDANVTFKYGEPDAYVEELNHQLIGNLFYATAVARFIYYRKPEPLPRDAEDWTALGRYWKTHYNTHLGKGTVEGFVNKVEQARQRSAF